MPALIQNHRKQAVETGLKKFYSMINQAVQMSELENGQSQGWDGCIGMADYMSCSEWYDKYLKKYLKTVKEEVVTIKNMPENSKNLAVYLTDGSLMLIHPAGSPEIYFFPNAKDFDPDNFLVRTEEQGSSLPQSGRKYFIFEFGEKMKNGEIVTHARPDKQRRFNPALFCIRQVDENRNFIASCPTTPEELMDGPLGCNNTSSNKMHCTALIQMNGWKIPKNYPFKF